MKITPPARFSAPRSARALPALSLRLPFRRGVTFIETVCAVALLALVAGSMLSAVGYLYNAQNRNRQRLACAELANRLLLEYIDDKEKLPAADAPLDYGHERFRWDIREEPVQVHPTVAPDVAARSPISGRIDRIIMVTVTVWLSEESGGSRNLALGVPTVSLWRFVDPLAFRNPDAINRMLTTDAGRRRLLESVMGTSSNPSARGQVNAPPRPGTGPTTAPKPAAKPSAAPIRGGGS